MESGPLHRSTIDRSENDPLFCSDCSKSFPTRNAREQHRTRTHMEQNQSRWVCRICGRAFETRASMRTHKKTVHAGNAPTEPISWKSNTRTTSTPVTEPPRVATPVSNPSQVSIKHQSSAPVVSTASNTSGARLVAQLLSKPMPAVAVTSYNGLVVRQTETFASQPVPSPFGSPGAYGSGLTVPGYLSNSDAVNRTPKPAFNGGSYSVLPFALRPAVPAFSGPYESVPRAKEPEPASTSAAENGHSECDSPEPQLSDVLSSLFSGHVPPPPKCALKRANDDSDAYVDAKKTRLDS